MDQSHFFEVDQALDGAHLRKEPRDRVLVMAQVGRVGEAPVQARVRDISDGGMMVDCDACFAKGDAITAVLRGVGAVTGVVAWVDRGGRFGMCFDTRIDAAMVRKPVQSTAQQPMLVKAATSMRRPGFGGTASPVPVRRFL